jgi:hypothetical protein
MWWGGAGICTLDLWMEWWIGGVVDGVGVGEDGYAGEE